MFIILQSNLDAIAYTSPFAFLAKHVTYCLYDIIIPLAFGSIV
jgi:hypothetical protein